MSSRSGKHLDILRSRSRALRLQGVEPIRLISATEVPRVQTGLTQNPRRQVAALTDLAKGGNLPVRRQLLPTRAQLVNRNVHGVRNGSLAVFLRGSHVEQKRPLGCRQRE